MRFSERAYRIGLLVLAPAVAHLASAATMGINNYQFRDGDAPLLRQLSASPVPLRMTFYWHDVAAAPDYYDSQVAAATEAGVPILGLPGYSTPDTSSMPVNFDFTEISPFQISWHTALGFLPWGSDGAQGTAKYLWQAELEDGRTYPRVVDVAPAMDGTFVHGGVSFVVPSGHSVVLWARAGFRQSSDPSSRAAFSVSYLSGNEFPTLAGLEKGVDGTLATLTADLTDLAGTTVKLFFNVDPSWANSIGDPVWQGAGILVDGVPLTMAQVVGDNVQSVINYPPLDSDAFASYAGDLARRYPQIGEWEVWNEPNISFFWRPAVNVEAYVALLRKVYSAVKAANPNANVVLGGLSPGTGDEVADAVPAADFLNQIYLNGGGAFFDTVAYHVYWEGTPQDSLPQALQEVRSVMEANGDRAKPVWITEIGCYTSGPGAASEAWQAEWLLKARMVVASIPYVQRVYWFTLQDDGKPDDAEQNYGLFRSDGSPKPAVSFFSSPLD